MSRLNVQRRKDDWSTLQTLLRIKASLKANTQCFTNEEGKLTPLS